MTDHLADISHIFEGDAPDSTSDEGVVDSHDHGSDDANPDNAGQRMSAYQVNAVPSALIGGIGPDTLTGSDGPDRFEFTSGDGATIITNFDPNKDTLRIDGVVTDPDALPTGVTAVQVLGDVLVSYGVGDTILLLGLDLAAWIAVPTPNSIVTGTGADDDFAYGDTGVNGNEIDDFGQTIFGLAGNDDIFAGWGNDTVDGGAADDTLNGDEGDDVIIGGTGNDTLTGGDDTDVFQFTSGDGADTITDFDPTLETLEIDGVAINPNTLPTGVDVLQVGPDVSVSYGGGDTILLVGIDLAVWLAATTPPLTSDGVITGTEDADILSPGSTDADGDTIDDSGQTINALGGNDSITAGTGDDVIDGGAGDDAIYANDGNDTIIYSGGDDVINAGYGNDTLDLSLYAAADVTFSIFGSYDVMISTPDGVIEMRNQLRNEPGYSSALVEQVIFSDTTLDAAAIRDRAITDQSTADDDLILATTFDDVIDGGAGDDKVIANDGDDTIVYSGGDDVINAGFGNDTLDLSLYAAADVTFSIFGSYDVMITTPDGVIEMNYQVRNDLGYSTARVEQVTFSDITLDAAAIRDRAITDQSTADNDIIRGTTFDDVIDGGAGNDAIYASDGDDTIIYSGGDDMINAGYGNDTLDLSIYAAADVTFSILGNYDVMITTPDGVIELNNQVRNELGHSTAGVEQITFSDTTLDATAIRDRAITDQITTGDDIILATTFDDVIDGGAGNDMIIANDGDDTIIYSGGDDVINAGFGNDTLDLSLYAAADVTFSILGKYDVMITTPDGVIELNYQVRNDLGYSTARVEQVTFSDITLDAAAIRDRAITDQSTADNDIIRGTTFDDVIDGGAGNDTVIANDGDDVLTGGVGDDTLSGGAGADTFVFNLGDGNDQVTYFESGSDLIDFSSTGLAFNDLTITTSGSGATLIDYGEGDQIALLITAGQIDENDFIFV